MASTLLEMASNLLEMADIVTLLDWPRIHGLGVVAAATDVRERHMGLILVHIPLLILKPKDLNSEWKISK